MNALKVKLAIADTLLKFYENEQYAINMRINETNTNLCSFMVAYGGATGDLFSLEILVSNSQIVNIKTGCLGITYTVLCELMFAITNAIK